MAGNPSHRKDSPHFTTMLTLRVGQTAAWLAVGDSDSYLQSLGVKPLKHHNDKCLHFRFAVFFLEDALQRIIVKSNTGQSITAMDLSFSGI